MEMLYLGMSRQQVLDEIDELCSEVKEAGH
jgi:hypothetical protein